MIGYPRSVPSDQFTIDQIMALLVREGVLTSEALLRFSDAMQDRADRESVVSSSEAFEKLAHRAKIWIIDGSGDYPHEQRARDRRDRFQVISNDPPSSV